MWSRSHTLKNGSREQEDRWWWIEVNRSQKPQSRVLTLNRPDQGIVCSHWKNERPHEKRTRPIPAQPKPSVKRISPSLHLPICPS